MRGRDGAEREGERRNGEDGEERGETEIEEEEGKTWEKLRGRNNNEKSFRAEKRGKPKTTKLSAD